jgi:hypothetical protein
MTDPKASRPHMPGYGLLGASEGTGLLPWSWAEQQLTASRNYPTTQATVRIRPRWAFGLLQADFEGSPTRWEFDVPPTTG